MSADQQELATPLATEELDLLSRTVEGIQQASTDADSIPVFISYEIIRLFSEGLYQSPQKAIEELVSNSYDAGASQAHVILPDTREVGSDADHELPPLWVVDNGHGLDRDGFTQLWRIADSKKSTVDVPEGGRSPIGQFGIGKLAAYVLAWRLTHISSVAGRIRLTSMNFRRLVGRHQYMGAGPVDLQIQEISEETAQTLVQYVRERDPAAWNLMFGRDRAPTWTAAGLSDFKELYSKLSTGRLEWVLRTGLPLHSKFAIWVNGAQLQSSKEGRELLASYVMGGSDDTVAADMELRTTSTGVIIPGIEGELQGSAKIFKDQITGGKSTQYGRSNGFFIRVRGRVINLEDELFGLPALNHSAWSRFSMEVDAEGLQKFLLSSREGVRETDETRLFQKYLLGMFNRCRRSYDDANEKKKAGLDLTRLLSDAPSTFVVDPVIEGVRRALDEDDESYYSDRPEIGDAEPNAWLAEFAERVAEKPFDKILHEGAGIYERVVRYIPETRTLMINSDHPFVEKLLEAGKTQAAATLFGSSEVMVDFLMQEHKFSRASIVDFLTDRDRVLRLVAGEEPSTAAEVLRLLENATVHDTAFERAVGLAFRVLGFEYERRGSNRPGSDGVLYARLGRGTTDTMADYKVVYDSKQSNSPSISADKVNIDSLDDFRRQEDAQFGFFIATNYNAQEDPEGKLNRLVANASKDKNRHVTLLRVVDLRRLVEIHYRQGITLTRLRSLFESAHTVPEVEAWIDSLEHELTNQEPQVPLIKLLASLEESKQDELARPNVNFVRAANSELRKFGPDRLIASLQAVETIVGRRWIEVTNDGSVILHHTASQIVAEVERNLRSLLGVNAMDRTDVL